MNKLCVLAAILAACLPLGLPCQGQPRLGPEIVCATRRNATRNAPVIVDLVVMNADGTRRTTLLSIQGNIGSILRPSWSPDLDPAASGYQGRVAYGTISAGPPLWTLRIDIDDTTGAITYLGTPE